MPIENDSKERGADKDNFFAMNLSFNYFADGFAGKRRYQSLKNNFFSSENGIFKNYIPSILEQKTHQMKRIDSF